MPRPSLDTRQFRSFIRNLRSIYGRQVVNRWSRQAFGGDTPRPLMNALRRVTPRRTGRTLRSIDSEVFQDTASNQPVLAVGGNRRRGGFVYSFLRGTQNRRTRSGAFRGRVRNRRLADFTGIGFQATARRYMRKFENAWSRGVIALRRRIRAG